MKRFILIITFIAFCFSFLNVPVFSLDRTNSYRNMGTAGFFKSEYDKLSDNPAYVGAKLDFIDYKSTITAIIRIAENSKILPG